MSEIERRFTKVRVETRAGDRRTIGGYAAKFNVPSRNLGGFIERVDGGFFNKSRGDNWPDVVARYNHDSNYLLGTTASGTLRLSVDEVGLDYEVDVPESRGEVYELIQRGDVKQSSFAFIVGEDDWSASDQGYPMRMLVSGQLRDVSPVSEMAAYPDATAGLRSLAERFSAPLEEVRSMAERDELRKFFVKTGAGVLQPRTMGADALVKVLGTEADPWADEDDD